MMKIRILNIVLFFILIFPQDSFAYGIFFDVNSAYNGVKTFSKLCGKAYDENAILTEETAPGVTEDIKIKAGMKPNKITGNVVRCANAVITYGGDRIINTYVKNFSALAFYVIVLSIMFHGMRMMFGVARHHSVNIMMVVKIVAVLFVCSPSGYFYLKNTRNALIAFPKNIGSSLVAFSSGTSTGTHSETINGYTDPNVPNSAHLEEFPDPASGTVSYKRVPNISWGAFALDLAGLKNIMCKPNGETFIPGLHCPSYDMDLIFDKFDETIIQTLGVSDSDSTSTNINSRAFIGLAALATGLFFTGPLGLTITMVALMYVTALMFAVAQLAIYFIVSALAINFLIAISPLALACMLFEYTQRITRIWFNSLIIYSIQPILLIAFMIMIQALLSSTQAATKPIMERLENKMHGGTTQTGAPGTGSMPLFDCGNLNSTTTSASDLMDDGNFNSIVQNAQQASNSWSGSQGANSSKPCGFKAFFLKLDEYSGSTSNNSVTRQDIQDLISVYLARFMIAAMMLSFLKQIPGMVNGMVSGGGGSGVRAVDISGPGSHLTDGGLKAVEGLGKTVQSMVARR